MSKLPAAGPVVTGLVVLLAATAAGIMMRIVLVDLFQAF